MTIRARDFCARAVHFRFAIRAIVRKIFHQVCARLGEGKENENAMKREEGERG